MYKISGFSDEIASDISTQLGKIKISDDFDERFKLFKRVVKTAKMLDTKFMRMFS